MEGAAGRGPAPGDRGEGGRADPRENVTLATITLQNYFRLYEKLAGMTGTAKTEEKEFVEIYNLHVIEIPTNVAVARADENDYIFKSKEAKWNAVLEDIVERHEDGSPCWSARSPSRPPVPLRAPHAARIPHNVLNAKEHEREGEIITDACQPGAVTIATNMAGRGVDIKLGEGARARRALRPRYGAPRVAPDRQPAARRSGRQEIQGDPLLPLRAGRPRPPVRRRPDPRDHGALQDPDDQPMEASILSRQIENAQKKVEGRTSSRANVLSTTT
jgi:preprotein translocase subunit SecA